jgi:triosephosphate isomerase
VDLIGTWKNKLDLRESVTLAASIGAWLEEHEVEIELQLLPPVVALTQVASELSSRVSLGCQNIGWDAAHALTGETSAASARQAGAQFVMIGHSERRTYLGETDDQVAKKLESALRGGLGALVCIGETYAERIEGATESVIVEQVASIEPLLADTEGRQVRIAYEPAWAITTSEQRLPADPGLAERDHAFIRRLLIERLGARGAEIPLIYGAGVNVDNVADFAAIDNVDGVLVGGASQSLESLVGIINNLEARE